MLGLPTQSGSGDGKEERQAVRGSAAATTREEWRVTTEIVLGLFWSDFGSTKYMDKI